MWDLPVVFLSHEYGHCKNLHLLLFLLFNLSFSFHSASPPLKYFCSLARFSKSAAPTFLYLHALSQKPETRAASVISHFSFDNVPADIPNASHKNTKFPPRLLNPPPNSPFHIYSIYPSLHILSESLFFFSLGEQTASRCWYCIWLSLLFYMLGFPPPVHNMSHLLYPICLAAHLFTPQAPVDHSFQPIIPVLTVLPFHHVPQGFYHFPPSQKPVLHLSIHIKML